MQYLGIDWGTRRACWCAIDEHGALREGAIPADHDGLARLALTFDGHAVRGCIEMMSGAVWVRDRLAVVGWDIRLADARKIKSIAPLACKTDRVDARVLADLVRRDLVPEVWVPGLEERANRERLRRRSQSDPAAHVGDQPHLRCAHAVGLRRNLTALRKPGAIDELAEHGVPSVWLRSITTLLAVIDGLDTQLGMLERELGRQRPRRAGVARPIVSDELWAGSVTGSSRHSARCTS